MIEKLDGTKYALCPGSPKLEGTRLTGPLGRMVARLQSTACYNNAIDQTSPEFSNIAELNRLQSSNTNLLILFAVPPETGTGAQLVTVVYTQRLK